MSIPVIVHYRNQPVFHTEVNEISLASFLALVSQWFERESNDFKFPEYRASIACMDDDYFSTFEPPLLTAEDQLLLRISQPQQACHQNATWIHISSEEQWKFWLKNWKSGSVLNVKLVIEDGRDSSTEHIKYKIRQMYHHVREIGSELTLASRSSPVEKDLSLNEEFIVEEGIIGPDGVDERVDTGADAGNPGTDLEEYMQFPHEAYGFEMIDQQRSPNNYSQELAMLTEMGFKVTLPQLQKLMNKHNGKLESVVNHLVSCAK